jgi:cytochrome c-type biogenesis protein CcmH
MTETVAALKKNVLDLKAQFAGGTVTKSEFDVQLAALERKILDAVMHPAGAVSATEAGNGPRKPAMGMLVRMFALIVVIAGAGYAWKGSPGLTAGTPSIAQQEGGASDQGGAAAPHSSNIEQISAMTEKLAARLQAEPGDVEGWGMLARSYTVIGKQEEALKAYEKALSLRNDDAALLADYADVLAMKNEGRLTGAPMKQVEKALKIDPRNIKALALAGSEAFDRKDYGTAIRHWGDVVKFGPSESPMVQQIQGGLDEARRLSGVAAPMMPAMPPGAAGPLSAAAPATAGSAVGSVSGTVTLSPALRAKAQPDDTVFVFARSIGGSRMPLAILRKQVKDLPIQFTLDDSMAMTPANTMTTAGTFTVGARVSKSGNAMPQPGDLAGQSGTVKVGAKGLQIEIKDEMKP